MKKLYLIILGIVFFNSVALSRNLEILSTPPPQYFNSGYFTNHVFETANMIESDSLVMLGIELSDEGKYIEALNIFKFVISNYNDFLNGDHIRAYVQSIGGMHRICVKAAKEDIGLDFKEILEFVKVHTKDIENAPVNIKSRYPSLLIDLGYYDEAIFEFEELLKMSLTQNDKLTILQRMLSIHITSLHVEEAILFDNELFLSLFNDELIYLNDELVYFLSLNSNSEEIKGRIKEIQNNIEKTQSKVKETQDKIEENKVKILKLRDKLEDIKLRIDFIILSINFINREYIYFGDINIGNSKQDVLTITNIDDATPLDIAVEIYGEGFKLLNNEITIRIQPGESKDLIIQFSPTATSNYTGSVLIRLNETYNPITLTKYTITVPLTGRGLGTISVDEPSELPTEYNLLPNYPNPFNPTTTIQYTIPKDKYVKLVVYDITGRIVKELVNGHKAAGKYNLEFNASGYTSGVYYYKIEAGSYKSVQKMMLIK